MDPLQTTETSEAKRLDSAAWSSAALELLAENGIDGVRVELLAKRLNVTKGSFYWHFKDRNALFENMLGQWRRAATIELIDRLDRGERNPRARLSKLLRLPIAGPRSAKAADAELAIRLWGRRDARAKAALEEVDELRLRYIAGLLEGSGVPVAEAKARAVLAYAYMRVAPTLIHADAADLMASCEMLLIGP